MFFSLVLSGLLVVSAGASGPHTPERTFKTGQLIENVVSDSAPGHRFAIYLPRGFDPRRPAPILYLMDPRGRSRVPVKLFQQAAERFGYILISSANTSSDGPVEPSLRAMQAMWDDTHAWFAIDPNRTYIAGFSGTARTASLLSEARAAFTGMIGAGAGLHPSVRPSVGTRFLYYGAAGGADYNFHEMEALETSLAALNLPHRVERHPGPHAWMPADVAMRAVEWFELRAMQAGTRPVDPVLVEAWWKRDDELARSRMEAGRALDAARQYAAMARDYAGLRDTSPAAQAAATVAASAAAKRELERRSAAGRAWKEWNERVLDLIASAFVAGQGQPASPAEELADAIGLPALKRTAARDDSEQALEARRRLNQLEVQFSVYLPLEALQQAALARAQYYLGLALQIDDRSPTSWYLVAQLHARRNRPAQALDALGRAAAGGFRDLAMLEADATFAKLRNEPGYERHVGWLRTEGDWIDPLTVDRPPASVLR